MEYFAQEEEIYENGQSGVDVIAEKELITC